MAKCIIIAPLYDGSDAAWLQKEPGDLLLCADGGYDAAIRHGLMPDLVVGDFDSMPESHVQGCPVLRLPTHKDDTDTGVCLTEARKHGYHEFRLAGCIGGRLDHTLANIQNLYDCALRGESAWLGDRDNRMTILTPGTYALPRMPGRKLSLMAYTPEVTGVNLTGAAYPLHDAVLSNRYPLGVSNEFAEDTVQLSFRTGALMILYCRDASVQP